MLLLLLCCCLIAIAVFSESMQRCQKGCCSFVVVVVVIAVAVVVAVFADYLAFVIQLAVLVPLPFLLVLDVLFLCFAVAVVVVAGFFFVLALCLCLLLGPLSLFVFLFLSVLFCCSLVLAARCCLVLFFWLLFFVPVSFSPLVPTSRSIFYCLFFVGYADVFTSLCFSVAIFLLSCLARLFPLCLAHWILLLLAVFVCSSAFSFYGMPSLLAGFLTSYLVLLVVPCLWFY